MSQKKINIAIAGATGYVGLDLVYYLSKHPKVNISYLCAQKNIGKNIKYFDKRITKKKLPKITELKKVDWSKVNLLFLSLPNGAAQKIVKKLYKFEHLKFIDLSADFRIEDPNKYKEWYSANHNAKNLISKSIYSIPEFSKDKIKKFRIIANPGCYPTSIQLALLPLLKKSMIVNNITIDSKSGYSGAGKNFKTKFTHQNFFESIFAYGIEKHRHMSELDQEFKKYSKKNINYTFNPHLLPTFRGILSSIYIETKKNISIKKIFSELKKFHAKNKFVYLNKINHPMGNGNVLNTNNCEISICKTRHQNKLVIFSAIDNLVKGASGQAIQNMNLAYNFKEHLGLT